MSEDVYFIDRDGKLSNVSQIVRKRARRHSWFVAFGITLFLCVAAGIVYLATDPIFPIVVVCLIVGCG